MRLQSHTLLLKVALCSRACRRPCSNMVDIAGIRTPYHDRTSIFDAKDLVAMEPFAQFQSWFNEARQVSSIHEPNAMALATATKDGFPSVRIMLMKSFDKNGFVFFTNYNSRKGRELTENPHCSLMFYWEPLRRSVRIEGTVKHVDPKESEAYFKERPRPSQIGALVSSQSAVISSREFLDERNDALEKEYTDANVPIPKPEYWGGYRVKPHSFEFWQGQTDRLHDRLRFRRQKKGEAISSDLCVQMEDGWLLERLSP